MRVGGPVQFDIAAERVPISVVDVAAVHCGLAGQLHGSLDSADLFVGATAATHLVSACTSYRHGMHHNLRGESVRRNALMCLGDSTAAVGYALSAMGCGLTPLVIGTVGSGVATAANYLA